MPCCSAFGCTNRSSRPNKSTRENMKQASPKITFHKFPKQPERRNAWAKAVRRVDWIPSRNSVLCSVHFTEDAFDRTSLSCVRLRETAVPSIFSYLQEDTKAIDTTSESVISDITPTEDINTMDVVVIPSTTTSTLPTTPPPPSSLPVVTATPESRESTSSLTTVSVETVLRQKYKQMKLHYQKKIKLLQQSERRHLKQIASLKTTLATLKNKTDNKHVNIVKYIQTPNVEILKRQNAKTKSVSLARHI